MVMTVTPFPELVVYIGFSLTLGQAEADRKILEIARRGHHHGVAATAIAEGDRHLFGNSARPGNLAAAAMLHAWQANMGRRNHRLHDQ